MKFSGVEARQGASAGSLRYTGVAGGCEGQDKPVRRR